MMNHYNYTFIIYAFACADMTPLLSLVYFFII